MEAYSAQEITLELIAKWKNAKEYTLKIADAMPDSAYNLSFERTFQSWATNSGKQVDDIKSNFRFDELSDKFERGEISAKQFRAEVMHRLDIKLTDDQFDTGWCDIYLDTYNGVDDLLVNLKRNYKLIALTITNIIHIGVWKIKYSETLQHFEKIFTSHELRVRKPEKNYQMVLDHLKLKPEQTIFLDDNIDNIKGAAELLLFSTPCTDKKTMCFTPHLTAKSIIGLKYFSTSDNCGGRSKKSISQLSKAGLYVATSVKSKCTVFNL